MTDERFFCQVHHRHLTWYEYRAGACFWCHPDKIPWDETAKHEGKGWEERRKIWRGVRDMPTDEREKLIPNPTPGPGVVTPSQAMLERWAAAQGTRKRS